MSDLTKKLLDFDVVAEAEDSGVDLPALNAAHQQLVRSVMDTQDDTHSGTSFTKFIKIASEEGFVPFYHEEFAGRRCVESLACMFHPDGVLLRIESYDGDGVNSANMNYCMEFKSSEDAWGAIQSGRFDISLYDKGRYVWNGHHDVRVGFRHALNVLRNTGTFLRPWTGPQFMWLLNYTDTDDEDYDYEAINERKLEEWPKYVKQCIRRDK